MLLCDYLMNSNCLGEWVLVPASYVQFLGADATHSIGCFPIVNIGQKPDCFIESLK